MVGTYKLSNAKPTMFAKLIYLGLVFAFETKHSVTRCQSVNNGLQKTDRLFRCRYFQPELALGLTIALSGYLLGLVNSRD